MPVSHAGCGQEHEVRSRLQCGGETGPCLFLSADRSASTTVRVVTSEKDAIHPEEGRTTLAMFVADWKIPENNAGRVRVK